MAGTHSPGFNPHLPGSKYTFLAKALGASMWFFIFYRARTEQNSWANILGIAMAMIHIQNIIDSRSPIELAGINGSGKIPRDVWLNRFFRYLVTAMPRRIPDNVILNKTPHRWHPRASSLPATRMIVADRVVVNGLRVFWIVVILWYELGVFFRAARNCRWPDSSLSGHSPSYAPSHILLVADPQILDHRSYPERGPLLTYVTRLLVDLNLRKNWGVALRQKPDAVVFLGDMMDGGRFAMSDDEYEKYYHRFTTIFYLPSEVPAYFIPGNHDTGLRDSATFSPFAKLRYMAHFGPLNMHISIANHTMVLLDAPGLVEEDIERVDRGQSFKQWKPIRGGSIEFVNTIAEARTTGPIVLLSHIPLSRDNPDCGPLREKGTIRPGVGPGYQNTLGSEVTAFLLQSLKPTVVFSGDDHDYCESYHPSVSQENSTPIREVTVKSLSMAMGIQKPGFQLLSLAPHQATNSATTYADTPCFLPDQLGIYLSVYVPFIVISLLAVFISNVPWVASGSSLRRHLKKSSSPLKIASRSRARTHDHHQMAFDDDPSRLPLPATSAIPSWSVRNMPFSWIPRDQLGRPTLGKYMGNIFSIPFGRNRGPRKRKYQSFLGGFLSEVRDIAIFPLTLFMVISLWTTFR